MGSFTIYQENGNDATVISNQFIDIYMKEANDAQLKVYLYLLRMMGAGKSTSVSDIADQFNHTEKDVMRALKYWEAQGLLALDFDRSENLTGIRILDLDKNTVRPAGSAITLAPVVSLQERSAGRQLPSAADRRPQAESVPSENASAYEKPVYSLDQVRAFREKNDSAQLLFIAEQYLGKTLSAADIRSMLFLSDKLHFSDDLIDYLLQYCVERGKRDFRYIEKVAVSWAEAGITTPKQAEKHAHKYDKNVYTIMKALGKTNTPTAREVEYMVRWEKEYAFSMDVILEACGRTVLATDKHRFEYADKILSSWKEAGIHHKEDIEKADASYKSNRRPAAKKTGSKDWFNQFEQRDYDFEALEKELLSN